MVGGAAAVAGFVSNEVFSSILARSKEIDESYKRAVEGAFTKYLQHGVYETREMEVVNPRQREQYFSRSNNGHYVVKPRIRNLVTFAPMNLAQVVYMGKFDCIFCMNVLIYFSPERQAQLMQRFYEYLEPGGYLFLGHAESISKADVNFETHVYRDTRIYQKPAASRTAAVAQERA